MHDIDIFSAPALFIEAFGKEMPDQQLSTATAFLIHAGQRQLLVTNWHVVNGKKSWKQDEILDVHGRIPGSLKVHFRTDQKDNPLVPVNIPLYDAQDKPLWVEHATRHLPEQEHHAKLAIDVALIDVTNTTPPQTTGHLNWPKPNYISLKPMETVAIIGYPFGLFGRDSYPIWITGTVANDLAGQPGRKYFLVDARSRPGNSGSPVIHRTAGASWHKPEGLMHKDGSVSYFMEIYSGRVYSEDSDIGIVWHWEVIEELLQKIIPGPQQDWRPSHQRPKP